jgi:hypothetical protein
MKKLFKFLLYTLGFLAAALVVIYLVFNKKKPVGTSGPEADALALKMFEAVDKMAWDSTAWVKWTYANDYHIYWEKKNNRAQVDWKGKKALLDLSNMTGDAYENGVLLQGEAATKVTKEAWKWFYNNMYWLCAPAKVMDPGTTRSIVDLGEGKKGLLVEYSSGGTTPGDTYLWEINDAGIPVRYQMWVSILPIGGVPGTWENWATLPTGAKISTRHTIGGVLTVDVTNLEAGM